MHTNKHRHADIQTHQQAATRSRLYYLEQYLVSEAKNLLYADFSINKRSRTGHRSSATALHDLATYDLATAAMATMG